MADDNQTYYLGPFTLQSGTTLPNAFIAYRTFGNPSLPAIIYPTWYSGLISDNLFLISPTLALNPEKYHIIIPALVGNGESSSPSNNPLRPWPTFTFYDNVRAQHELVTKHLGITHARAVLGWSMGAAQTYQWATQYPDFIDLIVPFCGSAKTSLHNRVFIEGFKCALLAAKGVASPGTCVAADISSFTAQEREVGLKALGRVYAGWAFSQAFYREKLHETAFGFRDLEAFIQGFWEKWALSKHPENMLAMAQTWACGDVSEQEPYNADFGAAMRGIKAKALVMPGRTDLYFP